MADYDADSSVLIEHQVQETGRRSEYDDTNH